MTKRPADPFDDDHAFAAFLRRHDSVTPPSTETLNVLENRIMAAAAAAPHRFPLSGTGWLPEMAQPWVSRSAGLLAIIILALGFLTGRDFATLSAQNTDAAALYASTGATPWQSFLTTASAEDVDDTSGEANDDDSQ